MPSPKPDRGSRNGPYGLVPPLMLIVIDRLTVGPPSTLAGRVTENGSSVAWAASPCSPASGLGSTAASASSSVSRSLSASEVSSGDGGSGVRRGPLMNSTSPTTSDSQYSAGSRTDRRSKSYFRTPTVLCPCQMRVYLKNSH